MFLQIGQTLEDLNASKVAHFYWEELDCLLRGESGELMERSYKKLRKMGLIHFSHGTSRIHPTLLWVGLVYLRGPPRKAGGSARRYT